MRRLIRKLSCTATAIAAAAAITALPAQTVQLAEGRLLLASVESADGDGLVVKRLDNGGTLELRWDQLTPGSALAIKRRFDLAGSVQDEVMVRADEVEYLVGGRKQTIIGKIVEQAPKEVVVRQRGVPFRIPRTEIRGVRQLDVPVGQIFTKDEWYAVRLAGLEDPSKADQHMLLAEDLIKVRDYEHASEHLAKAKELGNSLDPGRLDSLTTRLNRYKDAAKERELLDQIQACRSRGTLVEFAKGVKLIEQFAKQFPQSRLQAEFDVEKTRFGEARQRYLSQQIADDFRRAIRSVAEKKVREPGVTLAAAQDYAQNQMSDDLFAKMAEQFELDVEEVKELWHAREKYPVGKRTEHFAYGLGSWILGEQAIIKGTDVEANKNKQPSSKQPADPNSREIDRIARAMKQAMERRRAAGGGAGQERAEQSDEEWWAESKAADRAGWLRAFYAENGGELQLVSASASPCVSCYGEGTTVDMGPDGKPIRTPCFLCHNTKWMRSFKAY
ncbi:MAG: hypothetical protein KDE27_03090 [Planctomycetes bacterium]|nr:hypothetical protein [Planctomycetota bacterium]